MRFFIEIGYSGTNYCGWQRQPNALSVQEVIEEKLSIVLQKETAILGCGRTDAGVHASQFYFHFDANDETIIQHKRKFNNMLPRDIAVYNIVKVPETSHARFDATERAYSFHMRIDKNPFMQNEVYYYHYSNKLDIHKLNKAAQTLLDYKEFYPFCKSNNDAKTMRCDLRICEWVDNGDEYVFRISSDRFLRGMVRLIVGMCINVANQKLTLKDVHLSMKHQKRLPLDLSVPAAGLFLDKVVYSGLDLS